MPFSFLNRLFKRHAGRYAVTNYRNAALPEDRRDEVEVTLDDGLVVFIRRFNSGGKPGVAAAWPSKVAARELYRLCQHRDTADEETEIVMFEPGVGSKLYSRSADEFVEDLAVDTAITRFNTPNWSMVVWPDAHTQSRSNMIEYTGHQPEKDFLVNLLKASLPEADVSRATDIADHIRRFETSEPLAV